MTWSFTTHQSSQMDGNFDISNLTDPSEIPEVIILYSYQGLNPELIVKAVKDLGAKGIVLAGSGAGFLDCYG
nr:CNT_HP1_G0035390.mRNA.1.CDS.1 [Saccharomyces cerevisiae]